MTRYLVAATARETVAAACDYLDPELAEGDQVPVLMAEGTDGPVSDREAIPASPRDGRPTGRPSGRSAARGDPTAIS